MVFMEDSAIDEIPHVLLITLGKVEHGFRIPVRRFPEAFPLWVFPEAFEDRPYSSGQLLDPLLVFLG